MWYGGSLPARSLQCGPKGDPYRVGATLYPMPELRLLVQDNRVKVLGERGGQTN